MCGTYQIKTVPEPCEIVDSIRQQQQAQTTSQPQWNSGDLPPTHVARARDAVQSNNVIHVPNTNSFHVKGTHHPHVVTLRGVTKGGAVR